MALVVKVEVIMPVQSPTSPWHETAAPGTIYASGAPEVTALPPIAWQYVLWDDVLNERAVEPGSIVTHTTQGMKSVADKNYQYPHGMNEASASVEAFTHV